MFRRIIRKLLPAGVEFNSIEFFQCDLRSVSEQPLLAGKTISFHIVDSIEDQWLQVMCDNFPEKHFSQRILDDLQQCYIVIVNGQLAAFAWITTSSCLVSEINFNLDVGARSFYIYDCFVISHYRRQGFYRALLTKILADYRVRHGADYFRTVYIASEPGNIPSIRAIMRVGFERFANVRYLHMGQVSRWYGVTDLLRSIQSKTSSSSAVPIND